jgi:bifunctional non-homologous end joining protein LigD
VRVVGIALVRDEDLFVEQALRNVLGFCDELILADNGSRDGTLAILERLEAEQPELVTSRQRRELRTGRVLVDWLQNDATRSTVVAYSLRATAHPTVSAPLLWDEVEAALRARRPELLVFSPADVLRRVERDGDPFAPLAGT